MRSTSPDPPASDDPDYPAGGASEAATWDDLEDALIRCRACPRLVAWREHVATVRRRAFRDWDYWARPVPGFGPTDATLAIIGLAPAAHGGNRTGRIFTGDPSGDVLYAALHAVGLASQPTATHRGDGLRLHGVRITVPVHCVPPDNRPTPVEQGRCRPWLARELALLRPTMRVAVVLGGFGWQASLPVLAATGWSLPRPRPRFGHGVHVRLADQRTGRDLHLLGCYHPSQRNISTRTLTTDMLRDVLREGARLAGQ
jgi:uracil-DNA glycosylase family 4